MTAMLRLCSVLLVSYVVCEANQLIQPCTSCGPECESSCGSRNFRTCCYNYLKKRSPSPPQPPQQESVLRSRFPWLSTLLDGPSSRNSPDRDLQVQLFLLPDLPSSDNINHYRDYNSNYQENPPIGRLDGLTDTQPTGAPSSSDNSDTSSETSGETNQVSRESDRGRGQSGRRYQPYNWNSRNQPQRENFGWSEVNHHVPVYGA